MMFPTIELSKQTRTTSQGPVTMRSFVCSSQSLQLLLVKHRDKLVPDANYVVTWKDAKGWGVQIGRAAWQKVTSELYWSGRPYRETERWTQDQIRVAARLAGRDWRAWLRNPPAIVRGVR